MQRRRNAHESTGLDFPEKDDMETNRWWIATALAATLTMAQAAAAKDEGLIDRASRHGVAETVERIESTARARGLTVFARIDHSGEAQKAGLQMPPTQLIILGNPKGGTPVMLASPASAIDLPLKVLVRQGADGKTVVTINDHRWLQARHGIADDVAKPLAGLPGLLAAALD
jgi:uncharacterized protein (DUF302 family)